MSVFQSPTRLGPGTGGELLSYIGRSFKPIGLIKPKATWCWTYIILTYSLRGEYARRARTSFFSERNPKLSVIWCDLSCEA